MASFQRVSRTDPVVPFRSTAHARNGPTLSVIEGASASPMVVVIYLVYVK
jgi:hypothetical protein